jgi:hypothetical protein
MKPSDGEISRCLNALSTTLRDQRPPAFDVTRCEQIVTGALAGERMLRARATGPLSGELLTVEDDTLVAVIRRTGGEWAVERRLAGRGSAWALPQPAAAREQGDGRAAS